MAFAVGAGGSPALAACQMRVQAEMPVHMENRQPLLTSQVNGHDAEILADTGANNSLLFRSAVKRLGMQAIVIDNSEFDGLDGPRRAYTATADTVTIGSLKTRDLSLYVVGEGLDNESPVVGVLGDDFFSQSDVEFDLAHNVIRFLRPEGCKDDEVLYWGGAYSMLPMASDRDGEHAVLVQIKLNGATVEAQLDTGAQISLVNSATARRVGAEIVPGDGDQAVVGLAGRPLRADVARFNSVELDQEMLKNVKLSIAEIGSRNGEVALGSRLASSGVTMPQVLLGADFFMSHRVLISNRQHRVYFTYNGGPVFHAAGAR